MMVVKQNIYLISVNNKYLSVRYSKIVVAGENYG